MSSTSNLGVGLVWAESGAGNKDKDYEVDASAHIYEGDNVGINAGTNYARKLTSGDEFLGVALREVFNVGSGFDPNRSGDGTAGSTTVRVRTQGDLVTEITDGASALAGSLADIGQKVYAAADRGYTTSITAASEVGVIVGLEPDGKYVVSLKSIAERSF